MDPSNDSIVQSSFHHVSRWSSGMPASKQLVPNTYPNSTSTMGMRSNSMHTKYIHINRLVLLDRQHLADIAHLLSSRCAWKNESRISNHKLFQRFSVQQKEWLTCVVAKVELMYIVCRSCSCLAPNLLQRTCAATGRSYTFCLGLDRCDWCKPMCLCRQCSWSTNRKYLHDTIGGMSTLDRLHFWSSTKRPTPLARNRSSRSHIFAYVAFRSAYPDSIDKFQMSLYVASFEALAQRPPHL